MPFRRSSTWLFVWVGFLLIEGTCRADSDASIAEYERYVHSQRAKAVVAIPRVVRKYGEVLGCAFTMNQSNVVPYALGDGREFVALFSIDEGCSGGSAMSRPVFVALRWGGIGMWDLFIDPNYSLPMQSAAFPQTVTRIYTAGDELRFEALELQASDPLCCPSKRVSGRVVWTSNGWARQ
jgi:hypothetical protein